MSFALYTLSGLFVGFLVGLTGVGGGSLMTPILILLFGIHPATAVGSDLLYAAATKIVGTGVHGRHGSVDWRITKRLAAGSVPAVIVTLSVLAIWPTNNNHSRVMIITLGLILLVTSVLLVFRKRFIELCMPALSRLSPGQITVLTVAVGALLGFLVTTTSVGAGAIGMTALLVLYPRTSPVRLVGSDIAHAVPLTLLAGCGHWLLGDVDFRLVGPLLLGSVPGVIVGSLVSFRLPDRLLRLFLALVLAAASYQLLK